MSDLFKIGEPCWTWLNPNPHSKRRHRVSIYGGQVASCLNNQFMFREAMAGRIALGDTRDLSCKICIKRSYSKPLLQMQLLLAIPHEMNEFRQEIKTVDDTDTQRQAALIAADMLEERSDSRASVIRLICGTASDWECLYSLNALEQIRRDNVGEYKPRTKRPVTMASRSWLQWNNT